MRQKPIQKIIVEIGNHRLRIDTATGTYRSWHRLAGSWVYAEVANSTLPGPIADLASLISTRNMRGGQ